MSQEMPQGEKQVQYLSWQLTPSEQKYATIEKEVFVVKWAMETEFALLPGVGGFHCSY